MAFKTRGNGHFFSGSFLISFRMSFVYCLLVHVAPCLAVDVQHCVEWIPIKKRAKLNPKQSLRHYVIRFLFILLKISKHLLWSKLARLFFLRKIWEALKSAKQCPNRVKLTPNQGFQGFSFLGFLMYEIKRPLVIKTDWLIFFMKNMGNLILSKRAQIPYGSTYFEMKI